MCSIVFRRATSNYVKFVQVLVTILNRLWAVIVEIPSLGFAINRSAAGVRSSLDGRTSHSWYRPSRSFAWLRISEWSVEALYSIGLIRPPRVALIRLTRRAMVSIEQSRGRITPTNTRASVDDRMIHERWSPIGNDLKVDIAGYRLKVRQDESRSATRLFEHRARRPLEIRIQIVE
jgi:hypothetical protein